MGIVVAQFLDDLGDAILALILGGDAVVYNNRVELSGATDLAWAGGFLLCLIVGFLALFSYPTARGHGTARLALLWMLLHILRQAFGQAVLLPFDTGGQLAKAYATLDAPAGLDVVIAAGGGVGLLLIVLSAASAFLAFTIAPTAGAPDDVLTTPETDPDRSTPRRAGIDRTRRTTRPAKIRFAFSFLSMVSSPY